MTGEDLKAIGALIDELMDEKLKDIHNELKTLSGRIETLEIKNDVLSRKMEDILLRAASAEHMNAKEFRKFHEEMEALKAAPKAKNIPSEKA